MLPFQPLVRNPHLLTIAGNFAHRRVDLESYPVRERWFDTEEGVRILVHSQQPVAFPVGHLLMLHGLEGSSNAGYMRSMAQWALEQGWAVHRSNMRSCGGTDQVCSTMYHAGLTSDTRAILEQLRLESEEPIFLIGFSLGGNVALKLAGELGAESRDGLIQGVTAISVPIDLAACVRKMGEKQNRLYEWRFLSRLKQRIRRRALAQPGRYSIEGIDSIRTVYEFDHRYTAQFFLFGSADNYYATQSAQNFTPEITIPALIVQAEDDPLIPFEVFSHPAIQSNPNITLISTEHGGHLGYIARAHPHFWLDRVVLDWLKTTAALNSVPALEPSSFQARRKAHPPRED